MLKFKVRIRIERKVHKKAFTPHLHMLNYWPDSDLGIYAFPMHAFPTHAFPMHFSVFGIQTYL